MTNKKDDFDRMFDESYQDFLNSQKNKESDSTTIGLETKKENNYYDLTDVLTDKTVTKITDINKMLNIDPNFKPKLTFEERYKKWEEDYKRRNQPIIKEEPIIKKEPISKKNEFEEKIKNIKLENYLNYKKDISFNKESLLQCLIKILDAFVERDVKKINYFLKCFILILKERKIDF